MQVQVLFPAHNPDDYSSGFFRMSDVLNIRELGLKKFGFIRSNGHFHPKTAHDNVMTINFRLELFKAENVNLV